MVAGVAGGLARYLGIDTAWVRIACLALLFLGPGFFLYVIAWIAIPEDDRTSTAPVRTAGSSDNGKIILGSLLLLGGASMLANRYLPWMKDLWFPALLIALGTGVIIYSMKK